MDYFDTNIMIESEQYEDEPTDERIEALARKVELEPDPFETYSNTYKKAV